MTSDARSKVKAKQKKRHATKTELGLAPGRTSDIVGGASGVVGEASGTPQGSLCCSVCQRRFQSRNKLFQHIKSTGHAVRLEDPRTNDDITEKGSKVSRKKKKK